jgi:hypothetical protein
VIFRRPLLGKVLAGQKTMTRRPVKGGKSAPRYEVGQRHVIKAAQGERAVARILLTDVRQELLGDITALDAQREGFKRRDQFMDYWRELYGRADEDQLVWVIEFDVEHEMARYLAPSRSSHDYTGDPRRAIDVDDETGVALEVPDEATLQRYADEGWSGFADRQEARERDRLSAARDHLRALRTEARNAGVDINGDMRVIEQRLERIEHKLGPKAA